MNISFSVDNINEIAIDVLLERLKELNSSFLPGSHYTFQFLPIVFTGQVLVNLFFQKNYSPHR
jgi:hypothetical protein